MTIIGLLRPLAFVYGLVMMIRSQLYSVGIRKRHSFPITTIAIGNLSVGGTGKTPLVEYLLETSITEGQKTAVLSRGYKRKTKGFFRVTKDSTVNDVGDEPLQIHKRFSRQVPVLVCEKRVVGLQKILLYEPEIETVLLDDGFQHLAVKPTINLLLTTYQSPFYNDYVLPAGRLRESRHAAKRADLIIVTKCPHELRNEEFVSITTEIRKYTMPSSPVIFSSIVYENLVSINHSKSDTGNNIVLVTGIADATPMKEHLQVNHNITHHFKFQDHHFYTEKNIQQIIDQCLINESSLVTTEKDAVKLIPFLSLLDGIPVFTQPIKIVFLADGSRTLQSMISANL